LEVTDEHQGTHVHQPGKFEYAGDQNEAQRLHEQIMDGQHSDEFGSTTEEGMWMCLLGDFVCREDDQGFFYYAHYESVEQATAAFEAARQSHESRMAEAEHRTAIEEPVEIADE
jgi:hypothetical protein